MQEPKIYNNKKELKDDIRDKDKKRQECFVCGFPCGSNNFEYHHIFPFAQNNEGVPLCHNCHNLIDRNRFQEIEDISWFYKMMEWDGKINEAPTWCKMMLLLFAKTMAIQALQLLEEEVENAEGK